MDIEEFLKILSKEFDAWQPIKPDDKRMRMLTAGEYFERCEAAQEAISKVACVAFFTAMPNRTMNDFKAAWQAVKNNVPLAEIIKAAGDERDGPISNSSG